MPCDCCLCSLQAERLDAKASGLAAAISALEAQVEAEAGRARVEARTRVSVHTLYWNPGAKCFLALPAGAGAADQT